MRFFTCTDWPLFSDANAVSPDSYMYESSIVLCLATCTPLLSMGDRPASGHALYAQRGGMSHLFSPFILLWYVLLVSSSFFPVANRATASGCNTNYQHDHYVRGDKRTYYEGVPDAISGWASTSLLSVRGLRPFHVGLCLCPGERYPTLTSSSHLISTTSSSRPQPQRGLASTTHISPDQKTALPDERLEI